MENENQKENPSEISIYRLSALRILKQTKCQLLKTGSKPERNLYFICECDPDQKEPICKDCIDNCHKGHQIISSFETQAVCHCGLKMHERTINKSEKNEIIEKCLFSEWAKITKSNLIFKDISSEMHYCAFCISFCGCGKNINNANNSHINNKNFNEIADENNSINNNKEIEVNNNNNFDGELNLNSAIVYFNCDCTHENHKSSEKIIKHIFELFYYKSELNELKKNNFEPKSKKSYLIDNSEGNSNSNLKSDLNTIMDVIINENPSEEISEMQNKNFLSNKNNI